MQHVRHGVRQDAIHGHVRQRREGEEHTGGRTGVQLESSACCSTLCLVLPACLLYHAQYAVVWWLVVAQPRQSLYPAHPSPPASPKAPGMQRLGHLGCLLLTVYLYPRVCAGAGHLGPVPRRLPAAGQAAARPRALVAAALAAGAAGRAAGARGGRHIRHHGPGRHALGAVQVGQRKLGSRRVAALCVPWHVRARQQVRIGPACSAATAGTDVPPLARW